MASGPEIVDDKSPICIPFILARLKEQQRVQQLNQQQHLGSDTGNRRPFVIGLNGVQGVGKTTLVAALAKTLQSEYGLETLVVSIDDFYLPHAEQKELAAAQPDNKLVACRGEPGTHDMKLASAFLEAVTQGRPVKIPQYDKSAYAGEGDRVPESHWLGVNGPGQRKVEAVIVEGWCVGFRPLSPMAITAQWMGPSRTLQQHDLQHLEFVNWQLESYEPITAMFDAFIHLDAEDLEWVYDWRLEQEVNLIRERGSGMTREQVVKFVDAYYPGYELYAPSLRQGVFADKLSCHLRLVVSKDRRVKESFII
ncbi:D-glycerate 3-kinase [Apiospora aurea]|uniref:D-glycerate 3-kinase n=1 Tax=Apiospora aurea TaxID=335848 RepID=A0ABR1QL12_9PEZI